MTAITALRARKETARTLRADRKKNARYEAVYASFQNKTLPHGYKEKLTMAELAIENAIAAGVHFATSSSTSGDGGADPEGTNGTDRVIRTLRRRGFQVTQCGSMKSGRPSGYLSISWMLKKVEHTFGGFGMKVER